MKPVNRNPPRKRKPTAPAAGQGPGLVTQPLLHKAYQRFGGYPVFIGNLDRGVTETCLYDIFSRVGPIASIRLCRNVFTKQSLGYAYMNYLSKADAERAIRTMNFLKINGKECRLMWSLYGRNRDWRVAGNGNLFVRGLHESINNRKLYEHFHVYGEINSVRVAFDRSTGRHKGFGYVQFARKKDAELAMQSADGLVLHGLKLEVREFVPLMERIRRSQWTNVYVKYIPPHISEKELVAVFENACSGMVTSSKLWDRAYGRSACLNFATHEQAVKAVRRMAGYRFSRKSDAGGRKGKAKKGSRGKKSPKGKKAQSPPIAVALLPQVPAKATGKKLQRDEEDEKKGAVDDTASDAGSAASGGSSSGSSASSVTSGQPPRPEPLGLYVTRAQKKWERAMRLRERMKRRPKPRQLAMPFRFDVRRFGPDVSPQRLQQMLAPFGNVVAARVTQGPKGPSGLIVGVVPKWMKSAQQQLKQPQMGPQFPGKNNPFQIFVPPRPGGLFPQLPPKPVGPNDISRRSLKVPMSQFILPAATPPQSPPGMAGRVNRPMKRVPMPMVAPGLRNLVPAQ